MGIQKGLLSDDARKELYRNLKSCGIDSSYQLIRAEALAHKILPYTAHVQNFTLHDVGHSIRVIQYINAIVEATSENHPCNESEVTSLYIAGWLHDIGMIHSKREEHAKRSSEMIGGLETEGYIELGPLLKPVKKIVEFHSARMPSDFSTLKKETINGEKMDMLYLCAAFRLADESDMTIERAPRVVDYLLKDKLSPEAIDNWRANQAVKSIDYLPDGHIKIVVDDYKSASFLLEKYNIELKNMKPFIDQKLGSSVEIQDTDGNSLYTLPPDL